MPLRRHRITAIALAMVALVAAAPVWAQSADDLDEVEEQQDQLDEQLDVLQADHAELEAALEATNTRVRQQEAAKREAEQRLEVARAEVRAAQAAVTEMRAEIVDLSEQADEDAVNLYMNPDPTLAVMDAGDLTTATRREAVLSTIASNHSDVLDRLGGLEIDLVEAEARSVDRGPGGRGRAGRGAGTARGVPGPPRPSSSGSRTPSRPASPTSQAEVEALAEEEAAIRAALAQASQAPVGPGGSIDTPPSASRPGLARAGDDHRRVRRGPG